MVTGKTRVAIGEGLRTFFRISRDREIDRPKIATTPGKTKIMLITTRGPCTHENTRYARLADIGEADPIPQLIITVH